MPKLKKEDKIKIIRQAIKEKRSMGFGDMWFLPASVKRLKKVKGGLGESQQLRTLFTIYEDYVYTVVLLDGLNMDISYWVIWKNPKDMKWIDETIYQGFIRVDKNNSCEILSHVPSPKVGFNGNKFISVCKYCKMIIETSDNEPPNNWILSEQQHAREIRA